LSITDISFMHIYLLWNKCITLNAVVRISLNKKGTFAACSLFKITNTFIATVKEPNSLLKFWKSYLIVGCWRFRSWCTVTHETVLLVW
jgi:hypothetical protein